MNSTTCCNSLLSRVSAARQPLVDSKKERWPGTSEVTYSSIMPSDRSQKCGGSEDLKGLFHAIEMSSYSKVCSLVTCPGIDINGENEDNMKPLDVALLLGDTPVARVLQHHGAGESNRYKQDPNTRYEHVMTLLHDTEISRTSVLTNPCNSHLLDNCVSDQGSSPEVNQRLWRYHRMLNTLKNTALPGPPQRVGVFVQDSNSVKLECCEPPDSKHALITHYKVQWSTCPNLLSDVHTEIVTTTNYLSHLVSGLNKGVAYFFRVQAGNVKGFGTASPIIRCTLSHWSDASPPPDALSHMSRCSNILSDLRMQFNFLFPTLLSQTPSKYKNRNKSLSRIFTAPKFVKNLNRALYLGVLHYTDNSRILLSEFDKIPVVEVEDLVTAPSAENELVWLFKHALAGWPSSRDLKDELAPHEGVGGIGLRYKILSSVVYLQDYLNCTDLGTPYYRLVKKEGQLLILIIKSIPPNIPPFGGVHFRPLSSVTSGLVQARDAFDIAHLNAPELQTLFRTFGEMPTPGLFVGLLLFKMKGEELEIVVDKSSPLLPPLEYVRDVCHVTADEWRCLRGVSGARSPSNAILCKQVSAAACALLSRIHDTESHIDDYSIYTKTIIEIGDAAVILIIPPQVVAPLGNDNDIEGTISVPLQSYEILVNRIRAPELTSSVLHVTSHINTCHAIITQLIRQTLASEQVEQLKISQEKMKTFHEESCCIWSHYCHFSGVLNECMRDADNSLRSISELLQYNPSSSSPAASSVTETLGSDGQSHKQSGIVRIYSSAEVPVTSPCIKLHITPTTTARDVINSVIRKLRRQGHVTLPSTVDADILGLRLVASVSNVTHHIPDNVQILQLGQPWVDAKFFIRHFE